MFCAKAIWITKRRVNTERISCITWSSSINIWKITTSLVVSAVQFKAGKHCGFMLDDLASSTLQTAFLLKCGTELNSKTFTFWVKRTLKTHKSVSCGYEAALFKSFRADNLAQPTIWEKGLSDTCKLSASPFNLMQYPWMHVQLCVCVCVHADYNTLSFHFSCCICSYLETFFA